MPQVAPFPNGSLPRDEVTDRLVRAGLEGDPRVAILLGSRGWDKELLLEGAAERLTSSGVTLCRLDLAGAVTSPDEVSLHIALRLGAALLGETAVEPYALRPGEGSEPSRFAPPGPVGRIRALARLSGDSGLPLTSAALDSLADELSRRRGEGPASLRLALALLRTAVSEGGRPLAILARELGELGRLTPFPGLREAPREFASLLAGSPGLRLLASASPSRRPGTLLRILEDELPGGVEILEPPPMEIGDLKHLYPALSVEELTLQRLLALTRGRPLTTRILAERIASGSSLLQALSAGLADGTGELCRELRFDYHLLIERTRGHGASRAILNALAREEGLDLSGIASRLRRSGGSTLDYVRCLREVDLLRREGRRYFFSDPLLRLHLLLNEIPERPLEIAGRDLILSRALAGLESEPIPLRPLGRPRGKRERESSGRKRDREPGATTPRSTRSEDTLMEID